MSFIPLDDDDGEKSVAYLPSQKTRVLPSSLALKKWILSILERGHYLRMMRLSSSDGMIHSARGTDADADPNLSTFRRKKTPGRPPKKRRRGETDDEHRRRLGRERSAKHRARKKQKEQQT